MTPKFLTDSDGKVLDSPIVMLIGANCLTSDGAVITNDSAFAII